MTNKPKTSWEKRFNKRWLPSKKFKNRPEYAEAIKLCNEQKQFFRQELKREREEAQQKEFDAGVKIMPKYIKKAKKEAREEMGKALRMEQTGFLIPKGSDEFKNKKREICLYAGVS